MGPDRLGADKAPPYTGALHPVNLVAISFNLLGTFYILLRFYRGTCFSPAFTGIGYGPCYWKYSYWPTARWWPT